MDRLLSRRSFAAAFAGTLVLGAAFAHADDWRDDLVLRGFAGSDLRGAALRDQPLLLQFWESWCRSCGQMMADLDEVAARFLSVRYLVVSTDDDPTDARQRLEGHPLFPQHPDRFFHDSSQQLAEHFEVVTVPTVLVFDADGRERLRHSGHFNASQLGRLTSLLAELDSTSARSTR